MNLNNIYKNLSRKSSFSIRTLHKIEITNVNTFIFTLLVLNEIRIDKNTNKETYK